MTKWFMAHGSRLVAHGSSPKEAGPASKSRRCLAWGAHPVALAQTQDSWQRNGPDMHSAMAAQSLEQWVMCSTQLLSREYLIENQFTLKK